MTQEVETITPEASVEEAIQRLARHGINSLPVVNAAGEVLGLITQEDLIARESQKEDFLDETMVGGSILRHVEMLTGNTVEEIMASPVVTVDEEAPLSEVMDLMLYHQINCLPVTRQGRLVGLLAESDVLRALAKRAGAKD